MYAILTTYSSSIIDFPNKICTCSYISNFTQSPFKTLTQVKSTEEHGFRKKLYFVALLYSLPPTVRTVLYTVNHRGGGLDLLPHQEDTASVQLDHVRPAGPDRRLWKDGSALTKTHSGADLGPGVTEGEHYLSSS